MLVPLLIRHRFVSHRDQWTVEFDDYVDGIDKKRVLIDHIFVSEALSRKTVQASVLHRLYEQHNKKLIDNLVARAEAIQQQEEEEKKHRGKDKGYAHVDPDRMQQLIKHDLHLEGTRQSRLSDHRPVFADFDCYSELVPRAVLEEECQ
jgi:hypothetical protein